MEHHESQPATDRAEAAEVVDPVQLASGLSAVRKRRMCLWGVLIVYLPAMWATQKITHSFSGSMPVFFLWFVLLLWAMAYSATARCPRCKNYFHMHGMMLLYLRKCLHCQLPLNADKAQR